ncbi:hypothetical protein BH23ACT12_BH23ACT12_22890 [soil metagenome]
MSAHRRQKFEEHLLGCAACWEEVTQARRGRAIGESLRELAPQALREDLRAATLDQELNRKELDLRWLSAAAVMILAILGSAAVFGLRGRSPSLLQQPASITQAVTDYQNQRLPAEGPAARPAPDLAGMGFTVTAGGSGVAGSVRVDGFSYLDAQGRRLQLYLSSEPFPEAAGARMVLDRPDSAWIASSGDIRMLCAQEPFPLLALSDDPYVLDKLSDHLMG